MECMTATSAVPAAAPPGSTIGLPPYLQTGAAERLIRQVHCSSEQTLTTYAPYTGGKIATLPQCSVEDVAAAYARARIVQREWAARPVRERTQIILRFHDLLLARQDQIMDLIQAENGKPRRDAFLEVADIANTARYYARVAPGLLRAKHRSGLLPTLTATHELRHPKGVVTVISPWNYPLTLGAGDTIPALLAGNAVVQKPDNQTALTALWALELAREAGLPTDLWQIVLGRGSVIGDTLIEQGDYLMFTGSTASGKKVAAQAAARLIASSMELGGKNPMIVLDDADLDRAVEGALRACFANSGQTCVSIERMYVADSIYDSFVQRLVQAVEAAPIGAAYDYGPLIGSLTTQAQLDTIEAHVRDAVAKGATLLTGGKGRPDLGPYFYEPTILADVTPGTTCFAEETFGPLVSIYRFTDAEDAIARANESAYGLNASVWTKSVRRGNEVASRLRVGTVNVNEGYVAGWGSVDAPMGGMGESGLGRRHGSEGLLKYTEAQTVARERLTNVAPPAKVGYDTFARAMTAGLRAMRRVGWK